MLNVNAPPKFAGMVIEPPVSADEIAFRMSNEIATTALIAMSKMLCIKGVMAKALILFVIVRKNCLFSTFLNIQSSFLELRYYRKFAQVHDYIGGKSNL